MFHEKYIVSSEVWRDPNLQKHCGLAILIVLRIYPSAFKKNKLRRGINLITYVCLQFVRFVHIMFFLTFERYISIPISVLFCIYLLLLLLVHFNCVCRSMFDFNLHRFNQPLRSVGCNILYDSEKKY